MNLLEKFFKIIKEEKNDNGDFFYLQLNPEHEIYKLHFPNNPITPGVCLLQMLKEIVKKYYLGFEKTEINNIKYIKFINPVNPIENEIIIYQINIVILENVAIVNSTIFDADKKKLFANMKLQILSKR